MLIQKHEVKSLPQPILSVRWSVLPEVPTDIQRIRAITRIVNEVEIAKALSVPLNDQQKDVLVRLIAAEDWTLDEVIERGRAVIRNHTFGNIAFEYWRTEDEEVADNVKARYQCSYCDTEWWGAVRSRCPSCYPAVTTEVKPLLIECGCGKVHRPEEKCQI